MEKGHVEMETSHDFGEVLVCISMIIFSCMTTDSNIIGMLFFDKS